VNGAEGEGKVEAEGSERRVSRDGGHYTFDQFVDFFGETEAQWYWDQAAISPGRTITSARPAGLHRMTTTGGDTLYNTPRTLFIGALAGTDHTADAHDKAWLLQLIRERYTHTVHLISPHTLESRVRHTHSPAHHL